MYINNIEVANAKNIIKITFSDFSILRSWEINSGMRHQPFHMYIKHFKKIFESVAINNVIMAEF